MGWIIGIGCVLGVIAFVWLVVYWLNRDMWDGICGLGDFFDIEDEKDETSAIDEDGAA